MPPGCIYQFNLEKELVNPVARGHLEIGFDHLKQRYTPERPRFIIRNERGFSHIEGSYVATTLYNRELADITRQRKGWVELWRETSEQCMLIESHYTPEGWAEATTSPHWRNGVMPKSMTEPPAYEEAPQAPLPVAEKAGFGRRTVSIE